MWKWLECGTFKMCFCSHIEAGQKYVYIILKTTGCPSTKAADRSPPKKTWMQICATVTVDSELPGVLTPTETSWPASGPRQTLMTITFPLWQAVVLKKPSMSSLCQVWLGPGSIKHKTWTSARTGQGHRHVAVKLHWGFRFIFSPILSSIPHVDVFFSHVKQTNW